MNNLPAELNQLPVIHTTQELIAQVHNVFTPDKFNVLVPKALNISEGVKLAIQIVELDTNPNIFKNKDFWGFKRNDSKDKDNEAIFHANAIRKLAAAVNANFIDDDTCVVFSEYDDDHRPLILRAKAVCKVRDSLGNKRIGNGSYEYNYNNDLNDPRFKKTEYRNGQKVKLDEVDMDVINKRRQVADRLALTGAKKRAFFECMGYDSSIKQTDIGKPFVVGCVISNIDYNDPDVKNLMIQQAFNAEKEVFGGDNRQPIRAEAEVVETETNPNEAQQPAQAATTPPSAPPEAPAQSPQDKRAAYQADWQGATADARAKEIRKLAAQAKYDITKSPKGAAQTPPEQWDRNTQITWLMWLATKAGLIPAE